MVSNQDFCCAILARLTTALQLGVLVGFVVVAPKWDPEQQVQAIMRSMCKFDVILYLDSFVMLFMALLDFLFFFCSTSACY